MTTQIDEIARILGESPDTIADKTDDMMQLTQNGIIVTVTLRRYRGFSKLRSDDMGVRVTAAEASLMDLGTKRLLPKSYIKAFNSLDVQARHVLVANGFKTHWGSFIPASRYPWVKRRLDDLKFQYETLAAEIVENYERVREDVLASYVSQAQIAFYRERMLRPGYFVDEDQFIDEYMDRIRGVMMTREQIESRFDFEVKLSFVPLVPTLNMTTDDTIAAIEQRRIVADLDHVESLEKMHRDVLEQATREKEQLVEGFLREMMVQLRERTFLMMNDIKKSIDKNGRIHPRSVESLENWRKLMVELNAYGDKDVEKLVDKVQEFTSYGVEERNDRIGEITQVIDDISTTVASSLMDLGVRSVNAGKRSPIELPAITDIARRNARSRLGIADEASLIDDSVITHPVIDAPSIELPNLENELDFMFTSTGTRQARRRAL